ncbi:MAG: lysylphosphatidylglycerol synthase domain-containing protein [Dongiaceae bacterium]
MARPRHRLRRAGLGRARPGLGAAALAPALLAARWISKSINTLLPVAQVGGDVARTRWLWQAGVPGPVAGASVVVDVTSNLLAQVLYAALGVAMLAALDRGNPVLAAVAAATALAGMVVLALYAAQRLGLGRRLQAGRLARGGRTAAALRALAALEGEAGALYGERRALLRATLWHLLGWLLRTGETWLALRFMGVAAGLPAALVVESLSGLVRSAAFALPGGLGAQEAAILLVGTQLGLTAETAVALALVKRVQEFVVSAPGLVAWWVGERRMALGRRG